MSRANFVQVQLAQAATDIQTTLSVKAPVGGFKLPPADGGRLVLTDSLGQPSAFEVITYTGRTGSGPYTLTGVVRGVEGTVGLAWGVDTFVLQALTVGDLQELMDSKLGVGATAVAATKLATARTIALAGDVTGSASFDGSDNVSINAQVADDSHTHSLANLGLGSAATANVQTFQTDTAAGRLMTVGAFGLGCLLDLRGTVFEVGSPADLFAKGMVTGFARGGPDGLAIPAITVSNVHGVLTAYGHWWDATGGPAAAWREFRTGDPQSRVFQQFQVGGAWSQWREVFNTSNILGTVSQSAGVPTGAIIERGSNVNGEYVRFADGTQICTDRVVINRATPPGAKQNNLLTPAATFVGQPVIYRNLDFYTGENGGPLYLYTFKSSLGRFVNSGESGYLEFSWPPAIGGDTANSEVHTLYAIGRWY